jgi:hypothetical protein
MILAMKVPIAIKILNSKIYPELFSKDNVRTLVTEYLKIILNGA